MDICGFPKPVYYYWKAVWEQKPSVYVFPDWNFPKNSDPAQARVSRRKVLDYCASSGALVFPGHVGMQTRHFTCVTIAYGNKIQKTKNKSKKR